MLISSFTTDGIDGPTNAVGTLVDGRTLPKVAQRGLEVNEFLNRNDTYTVLKQIQGLIITAPTATNVVDVNFVLVA